MITLRKGEQQADIDAGELVGYSLRGVQFMHQKGDPGWGRTDIEMFPVIGPTSAASYRIQVPRGNAIQDQHGLLRELNYDLQESAPEKAVFFKEYSAGTPVPNSKYPSRSEVQRLIWPFSFSVTKTFRLGPEGLQIDFLLEGEKDMPFMFGYHPAFALRTPAPYVMAGDRKITLEEVVAAGSSALLVPDRQEIGLYDDGLLHLKTKGFRHFMLWTEVPNMLCIEPITFYPYTVAPGMLHTGFDYLEGRQTSFQVLIQPGTV